MDNKLRDEALLWIKEVATILIEGARKDAPQAAEEMERETSRFIRTMRRLSKGAPNLVDEQNEPPLRARQGR